MAKQRAENSSLSELPLIEWKEAASVAGEDDEGFLVDLLAGFYEEEFHVIDEIIEVFREYREGKSMDAAEAGKKVQNLAHRLKGAAANIRLMRLTRVRTHSRSNASDYLVTVTNASVRRVLTF
eukprot:gb/GECG01003776.1/.p1 GENE.gb/GECG01003776.1/~~gb/GECG01003776.1/.p1  ORF type:complete len:123 (+),score=19.64 gb/GECG01003776.1/:1-369(+)